MATIIPRPSLMIELLHFVLQQWSKYLAQLVMYRYIPVIDKKINEISDQYFRTGDPLH